MPVIHVPPDNQIYGLGPIAGVLYLVDPGGPVDAITTYNLTIINVNQWIGVQIPPNQPQTYPANGNDVYIQNQGPDELQAFYVGPGEPVDPAAAGVTVVDAVPGS